MSETQPSTLSPSQARALEALTGTRENIFLTGQAGTGKSFVLQRYLRYAEERGIRTARLAPTGIAAIPMGGETVHSFFRLKAPVNGEQALDNLRRARARVRAHLNDVDVIIIDEVSMLHGWLLGAIEEGTREVLGSSHPWGGKRIIVVGDFLQLAPVESRRDKAAEWQWAFHSAAWKRSRFRVHVLSDAVRQTEPRLIDALNEARVGSPGPALEALLRERSGLDVPPSTLRLFAKTNATEAFNAQAFAKLDTQPIRRFVTEYDFREDLGLERVDPDEFPIPEVLELRPGAEVIFRQNHPQRVWINGTRARVKDFASENGDDLVVVQMQEDRAVVNVPKARFPIRNHRNVVLATAENFPFQLAWGLTIHKSQGMTLDRAYIDLSEVFTPGQAYVALSRVRSERGVFLAGGRPEIFADVDRAALAFMTSLKSGEICMPPTSGGLQKSAQILRKRAHIRSKRSRRCWVSVSMKTHSIR